MTNKIDNTLNKINNTVSQVDDAIAKVKDNPYVRQGMDMLAQMTGIVDLASAIRFAKNYKPYVYDIGSFHPYEDLLAVCKARGIKVKQKRRFGFITIASWFKGKRDEWLRTTTTIDNTIWLSLNFKTNTSKQKAKTLCHEINHHIIQKSIGRVKYDASYITNKWFKLAIEMSCYKANHKLGDSISSIAKSLSGSAYDLALSESEMVQILEATY